MDSGGAVGSGHGMILVQKPYIALYENKNKFIILVTGGRGSAKSFNVSTFVERLTFEEGHKILFSRYTMASANISVIPEFHEKMDLEGTHKHFHTTKTEIINLTSGSEIMFRPIKTSSGNQTANLKSIQGLTTFVGDEMEEWESEDDFDKLVLSIRKKGVQNRVILVMNPSDAEHFVYKKYIENSHKVVNIDGVDVQVSTHPDVLHIHTTYLDNIDNVDDKFLSNIASIKEKSVKQAESLAYSELISKGINDTHDSHHEEYKRLFTKYFNQTKYAYVVIGRWADIAQGAVITNWEEGDFDDSIPYAYGQDYGFSIDPTTLIKLAIDEGRKRVYVKEEYYKTQQLGTNQIYEVNRSRIAKPNDLIVGDSQEARLIMDLQELGLNIIECEKGPGSVAAGLAALDDYTLVIDPGSHNIKKEVKTYVWSDKKAGIPVDKNNHAIDAIRYVFRKLTGSVGELTDEFMDSFH